MKIAFFIHEDYDFTFKLLYEIIPNLKKSNEIVGILVFPNILAKNRGFRIYQKYLEIFGLAVFMKLGWASIWNMFSLIFKRFINRLPFSTFDGLGKYYGIQKLDFDNPNDISVIKWVKENNIDIIIQFAGYILKKDIIESPKVCILNKHAGLLPSNKGVFPVFWSLFFEEPIAVTIHKINEAIDEGEIIFQKVYPKNKEWSVFDYYKAIFAEAPSILEQSVNHIKTNARTKVDHTIPSSYRSLPSREDYEKFKKNGFTFV
jgi:methionyl-tRNA formyltransferase